MRYSEELGFGPFLPNDFHLKYGCDDELSRFAHEVRKQWELARSLAS
jgi:hypothetical protein